MTDQNNVNVVVELRPDILGQVVSQLNIEDIEGVNGVEHPQIQIVPLETPGSTVDTNTDDNLVFDLIDQKIKEEKEDIGIGHNCLGNEGAEILNSLTGFGGNMASFTNGLNPNTGIPHGVTAEILVQPAVNRLRFRYQCEGRSAGALQGDSSTPDNRTFPKIKINGYHGPAVVVVSCVEQDGPPYKTHPHNLVGKHCLKGVCRMDVGPDMTATFTNLGIQCVRRKDAPASLLNRQKIKVDPYKTGFNHLTSSVNLNAIRLCFQVFLTGVPGLNQPYVVPPVVSNIIRDRKAHGDLSIVSYSDNWSPVEGQKKILLFCERVSKDDIEVHFTYEDEHGETQLLKGHFTPNDVHKQYGIQFFTPPFTDQKITSKVYAQMFLYKPSEQATSDPVDFYFHPKVEDFKHPVPQIPPLVATQTNRQTNKRTRSKNTNSDESSRQKEIKPKYKASGGGVIQIEDTEERGPSFIEQLNRMSDDKFDLNLLLNNGEMQPPSGITMQQPTLNQAAASMATFNQAVVNNPSDTVGNLVDSSEIDPNFFENVNIPDSKDGDNVLQLSGNLSSMKIGENEQQLTGSAAGGRPVKLLPRQSSQLDTPDVSMEKSKSSSAMRNNLDQY